MIVCKTCGRPIRYVWGSRGTTENFMRVIHDSPKCRKRISVKVREVIKIKLG